MPLTRTTLGFVLCHIYDFPFWCAVYLPTVDRYEADTPCVVSVPKTLSEEAALHQVCLDDGFQNWLNLAAVSDVCDGVPDRSEASLVAAFNGACREGEWLWEMMNYRRQDEDP